MASKRESDKLLIYGASGHGKVVIDIVEKAGRYRIAGLLDDNPELHGKRVFGYPVLGGLAELPHIDSETRCAIVAIGANEVRQKLAGRLRALGYGFACAVHPSAQIGRGVTIGAGTIVMAGALINSDTRVGEHVIIPIGAAIAHDCVIGDFARMSVGAHLAGGVTVGRLAWIGMGADVIEGVRIGEGTVVGAGAAVIGDLPDHVVAVGVPARIIKRAEGL